MLPLRRSLLLCLAVPLLAACDTGNLGLTRGQLRISLTMFGLDLDPDGGYVTVDSAPRVAVSTGGTVLVSLEPGIHTVALSGLADNCTADGEPRRELEVRAGATQDVAFLAACVAVGSTGFDVTIATAGRDLDDSYRLTLCTEPEWDCMTPSYSSSVLPADTTIRIYLAPGLYYGSLIDVAANCRAHWDAIDPGSGGLIVAAGERKALRIDVTCLGSVRFTAVVASTGSDRQTAFQLTVDGQFAAWILLDEPFAVVGLEGEHDIGLANLQDNCHTTTPNPVRLTLTDTTLVVFAVECQARPVLQVSVSTTGTNIPSELYVGIDPSFDGGFDGWYTDGMPVAANGSATLKVTRGAHQVWLEVPAHCSVNEGNPVSVNSELGTTTAVNFAVTCH